MSPLSKCLPNIITSLITKLSPPDRTGYKQIYSFLSWPNYVPLSTSFTYILSNLMTKSCFSSNSFPNILNFLVIKSCPLIYHVHVYPPPPFSKWYEHLPNIFCICVMNPVPSNCISSSSLQTKRTVHLYMM